MFSIERLFAAVGIAVCAVLLLRLLIGDRRRWRLDAALRRHWRSLTTFARQVRLWRSSRRDAAKVADEAIRRAREGARRSGEWDGNVYKPKAFRKPPHDKMH